MSVLYLKCLGGFCVCSSGEYALKKVSPGLRVSDVETLSLQKPAENGKKNPQKTRHRRLFLSNADSCQLRVSKHPANPKVNSAGIRAGRASVNQRHGRPCVWLPRRTEGADSKFY